MVFSTLLCAMILLPSCHSAPDTPAVWHLALHQAKASRQSATPGSEPRQSDQITISSGFDLVLSPDAEQALHQGITLQLSVHVRNAQHYRFWALLQAEQKHLWTIDYLPLSRQYRLRTPDGQQHHYTRWRHLSAALKEPQNFTFELETAAPDTTYQVQIRAHIDLQELPAPLRLPALFSPQWQLTSGWSTWILAPA